MRTLYYASMVLAAPFYLAEGLLIILACCVSRVGDFIYDQTTHRVWSVMHRRW